MVADPTPFEWSDAKYLEHRRKKDWRRTPISIYEVHLGSWRKRADGTFMSYERFAEQLVSDLTSFVYPGYWVGMKPFDSAQLSFSDGSRDEIRSACAPFLGSFAAAGCAAPTCNVPRANNTRHILCWDRHREVHP